MVRRKRSSSFSAGPVIFLALVVFIAGAIYFFNQPPASPDRAENVQGVPVKAATVPRSKPALPIKTVKSAAKKAGTAASVKAGTIAVVLDDWGYNRTHCRFLNQIPGPVGVAILPGLPYSQDVIACARLAGKEPMLHLPFEPHRSSEMYQDHYLLKTSMSRDEAFSMLVRILNEMKGVAGVNNHTGSSGTENPDLVRIVLAELKRRKLFFVDSLTTPRTVCAEVAASLKMRIARRDVFLDNINERAEIEHQFARALRIARDKGHVLVIGHDRVLTIQILIEQMKKLKEQGFEFIPVAEYVKRYEYSGN